eukprot:TRINITY_DN1710_c0_g1_i2.p1 TRINITY_DN1710_c0_g1~~TRINITY_DN1710_c0_g1_i2.p1  ORF type:complete len:607 (-),score=106.14 TRINITY_DN1710_c0_g1_i2:208-2028(-)
MASLRKLSLLAALQGASGMVPGSPENPPCLCVFDVDRTLTGYQDLLSECPSNKLVPGVEDYAYLYDTPQMYGNLTLSLLLQNLSSTFCSKCYVGIASAGGASLDGEKAVLLEHLRAGVTAEAAAVLPETWSTDTSSVSQGPPPFVVFCPEGTKQHCTATIVDWYQAKNVSIASEDVYVFDDKENNILAFNGSGFNAQQVSCGSRNGTRGLCGARPGELQQRRGVYVCESTDTTNPSEPVDTSNASMQNKTVEENRTAAPNNTSDEKSIANSNVTDTSCHENNGILQTCSAKCFGQDGVAECASQCFLMEGFSNSCAACLGNKSACSIVNCLAVCAQDPNGNDCLSCATQKCGSCETDKPVDESNTSMPNATDKEKGTTAPNKTSEESNTANSNLTETSCHENNSILQACGAKCYGKDDMAQCSSQCLMMEGFSSSCASCLGDKSVCSVHNCLAVCAQDPNGNDCLSCATQKCGSCEANSTSTGGDGKTSAEVCVEDSAKLQACGAKCFGKDNFAECSSECLQDEGFSSSCASCLGEKSACSATKCITPCAQDPNSDECFSCSTRECGQCDGSGAQPNRTGKEELSGARLHASCGCLLLLAVTPLLQ